MTTSEASTPVRILIINPNTSQHMTDALKPVVEGLGFPSVEYTFFTSPTPGIPSINSPSDAARSAEICYPALIPLVPHHDAFLVACYSAHPLVGMLKEECARLSAAATQGADGRGARKYVTGIFEASCLTSLALVSDSGKEGDERSESKQGERNGSEEDIHYGFGIVSTGKIWESALQHAVEQFLGISAADSESGESEHPRRFYGCETTGLNASELHDLPAEKVRRKMMDATKRLLRRGETSTSLLSGGAKEPETTSKVKAICLGCAGMVGLDSAVREACIEELGVERGKEVYIVDGVKAGVGMLYGLARCGF